MKKIWLINHYAMPPELESRLRTIKFAEYLMKKGYNVTIFGASSMHNMNLNLINDKKDYIEKKYGDLNFVHVRAKSYTNFFQRISNLFEFTFRLFKISNKFEKPDIILHTANVPFNNGFYFLAKKLKAKYYVEILDLWPESFVQTGILKKNSLIMPFLYFLEKWLYKRAEKLIFSMEGGKDYIRDKQWDLNNGGPIDLAKVHYINNGVDLTEFNENLNKYRIEDLDLNDETTFKIVYLGSIRLFNDVKLLIEAAEKMISYKDIVFLIYGNGDERQKLEEYVKENQIKNVKFKEKFINKEYIPYLLSRSSINVLNYQQSDIWKYGGSQSKLFQYLASGKPLVSNVTHKYCVIREYNCGISNFFKTAGEYSEAFLKIKNMNKEDYNNICINAKETARLFDYKKLTDDLIALFSEKN